MNPFRILIKSIFFCILFSLLSKGIAAQNHLGIYLGLGACKEGNSLISTSFKTGFEGDAFYHIDIAKHFDIRVIAGYKLRGFKDEVTDMNGNPTSTAIINYHLITFGPDLLFPIIEKNNRFYLLAGFKGNYLASTTGAMAGTGISTEEYAEMLDKLQLEASAGIGFEMPSGFFMEALASGNCLNKGNKKVNADFKAHDFYFGAGGGYKFH